MAAARAFPYLRYDPDEVGDPGQLLAPPYDVVTPEEVERMRATSPYHSIRIESPPGDDVEQAARDFQAWIDDGVLEGGEVGVAVVQQRYVGPDGVRRTRLGVMCEVKLAEYDERVVLPHERTMGAPKRLRLDLMRATHANISPVFLLYHDPERSLRDMFASVTDDEPDFTAVDPSGTQTAVWFVTDIALCELLSGAVAERQLLIADGHHRYESALAYRAEARERQPLRVVGGDGSALVPHTDSSGPDGVLAVLANSADEGMCVFPTHRVLTGVDPGLFEEFVLGSGAFTVDGHGSVDDAVLALEALAVPGFVVCTSQRVQLAALADPDDIALALPDASDAYRNMDVVVLHALVLDGGATMTERAERVAYTRSLAEAQELVAGRDDAISFIMRSVDVEAVHVVANGGEVMPQKSTYFYPKVPTGVVFRPLEPLA